MAPPRLAVALVVVLGGVWSAGAQELGQSIYERVAPSVFVVEALDEEGSVVGQGSAFVTAPGRLITNAHVLTDGQPFVRIDGTRMPCEVVRLDAAADLALLSISADLRAAPLPIADHLPKAGSSVFAVGNPRGLERTITQGLVSGMQRLAEGEFLQISAEISRGSSGGPVVDGSGVVLGVVVRTIESGQALNFAVPAPVIRRFLGAEAPFDAVTALIEDAQALAERQSRVASQPGLESDWQELETSIRSRLRDAAEKPGATRLSLLRIAKLAEDRDPALALDALGRVPATAEPETSDLHVLRARLLMAQANAELNATERQRLLLEAERHGMAAVAGVESTETLFVLASIQDRIPGRADLAYEGYQRVLIREDVTASQRKAVLIGLTTMALSLQRADEAARWARALERVPEVSAGDWLHIGQRFRSAGRPADAGQYLLRAAARMEDIDIDLRPATLAEAAAAFLRAADGDRALAAARAALDASGADRRLDGVRADAHRIIATVLGDRNEFTGALEQARKAVAARSTPATLLVLARALNGSGRHREAVEAASGAIKQAGEQLPEAYYELGEAWLKLKDPARAARAFKQAAALRVDPGASHPQSSPTSRTSPD